MWANRITLDFVKHDAARAKIQSKLDEKGITDECITDLHIFADSGYVGYKITLSDKSYFTIFDDGNEISDSRKKITDLLNGLDSNMEMLRRNNDNDNIEYVLSYLHSIIHELVKTLG